MASRFRVYSCRVFGFRVLGLKVSRKPQARKLGNQVKDRSITAKHKIEAQLIPNSNFGGFLIITTIAKRSPSYYGPYIMHRRAMCESLPFGLRFWGLGCRGPKPPEPLDAKHLEPKP